MGVLSIDNAARYYRRVILSFADTRTESVWLRQHVAKFDVQLQRMAYRKLLMLNRAEDLRDLRVPPGNRLEKLKGDRQGQYSIRINSQFRIVFRWTTMGAEEVEIIDYH